MPTLRLRALGPALLLVSLLHALPAHAGGGDGVGLGPLFALSASDDSQMLGWELSASFGYPSDRAALGGCYPLSRLTGTPGYHYAAWEPSMLALSSSLSPLGATLGGALDNDLQPRAVYGTWVGMAMGLERHGLYVSEECSGPSRSASAGVAWA